MTIKILGKDITVYEPDDSDKDISITVEEFLTLSTERQVISLGAYLYNLTIGGCLHLQVKSNIKPRDFYELVFYSISDYTSERYVKEVINICKGIAR